MWEEEIVEMGVLGCRERKRELGRKYLSCSCLHEWRRLVMIECKGLGLGSISSCDSKRYFES